MSEREYDYFRPYRMSSWWCSLEDLLWPQRKITDKIKRRAEGFAKAGIDTAINFGFHARFDFSNYFGSLHGYLGDVCEELHKYGIKYMDHYSCNIIERPKNEVEYRKMHAAQRHHILLHPDEKASAFAQYEGHMFRDICEVDVRDGSRGYTWNYQGELFCHNNPDFLDMHTKYLKRLTSEVHMDGIEVDDMCDYAFLATCGCKHCKAKFLKNYGHELPLFSDSSFWGNTSGHPTTWGNYENPVFRDWIKFKADSVVDHVKEIKKAIGNIPLMTCCSSTGPILLNTLGLNLERMMDDLDLLMLENCGTGVGTVNWSKMDAEALQQKDIAEKMGNAPAIALSYTIFDVGAYLGWALSRFWGVGNWSSTLLGRLEKEPEEPIEIHELVHQYNNWEINNSELDVKNGNDLVEARLVSNIYCRDNGWRDENGIEHWTKVSAWSKAFVENNIGYRIIRAKELSDAKVIKACNTPLILDGVGCMSDAQYDAICQFLAEGGKAFLTLPFGTHDEKGYKRSKALSEGLIAKKYAGLVLIDNKTPEEAIKMLISSKTIMPKVTQISGDKRWSMRLRMHPQGAVIHFMNRALEAIPHAELKEALSSGKVLADVKSVSTDDILEYVIDFEGLGSPWVSAVAMSPEIGEVKRPVKIEKLNDGKIKIVIDLTGVKVYGVVQ